MRIYSPSFLTEGQGPEPNWALIRTGLALALVDTKLFKHLLLWHEWSPNLVDWCCKRVKFSNIIQIVRITWLTKLRWTDALHKITMEQSSPYYFWEITLQLRRTSDKKAPTISTILNFIPWHAENDNAEPINLLLFNSKYEHSATLPSASN